MAHSKNCLLYKREDQGCSPQYPPLTWLWCPGQTPGWLPRLVDLAACVQPGPYFIKMKWRATKEDIGCQPLASTHHVYTYVQANINYTLRPSPKKIAKEKLEVVMFGDTHHSFQHSGGRRQVDL